MSRDRSQTVSVEFINRGGLWRGVESGGGRVHARRKNPVFRHKRRRRGKRALAIFCGNAIGWGL